jgi:1,4-alpha-glucan branching enzyme
MRSKLAPRAPERRARPRLLEPHDPAVQGIAEARHPDPHSVLGPHDLEGGRERSTAIRAMFPGHSDVTVVARSKKWTKATRIPMLKVHQDGFFEALIPANLRKVYQFEIAEGDGTRSRVDDPYRFPVSVSPLDLWLFNEGSLEDVGGLLGAHEKTIDGVQGFTFALWAPNARRASVVGEWNRWDGRKNPMRRLGDSGVWEVFLPRVAPGLKYKFELTDARGQLATRADPAARHAEVRPGTASITVGESRHVWHDAPWMEARERTNWAEKPVSTYEMHLGSWLRRKDGGFLNYREMADRLLPYLKKMNYTHVELMGLLEHPLDESWGYQVTGYYAPTSRHGTPDDFKYFVDKLHGEGFGVKMDWVPAHFPKDASGLHHLDGTHLFDHEDERLGEHKDWGTRIFNYGRNELSAFLIGSVMHFLKEYHLDGVRVDAVASMLYRDYSRREGEWLPNVHGGRENLEAIEFLRKLNRKIGAKHPGVMRIAEESTDWPGVTKTEGEKALGFDFKWNMGWMNDTLRWFGKPHEYRGKELDDLTNTFLWAHAERYVCALSHDEVVHGKNSLLNRMPGDEWQKFANLRLLFGYMWSYPGHKLLFMGNDMAQRSEWNATASLDWRSLKDSKHLGVQRLVADLNRLYQTEPALYQRQFDPAAMEMVFRDHAGAAIGVLRKGKDPKDSVLFVHNMTHVPQREYRIGVDRLGEYREILNTDSAHYGGSNLGNGGLVQAEEVPFHGKPYSVRLTLPPLATIALKPA